MPSNKVVVTVRLRVKPKSTIKDLWRRRRNIFAAVAIIAVAIMIIISTFNFKSPFKKSEIPQSSSSPFAEGLHIVNQGNLSLGSVHTETSTPGQVDVWYYDNWDRVNVWTGILSGSNPNCTGEMDFYISGKIGAEGNRFLAFGKATDIGVGGTYRSLSLQGGGYIEVFGYNPQEDWLTFCSQPFDYAFTIQSAN